MFATLLLYGSITATLSIVLYKWITLNDDYFSRRNLPHLAPNFLFGNTLQIFLNKCNFAEFLASACNQFPGIKIIGLFNFREPIYIIRDPDVIRQLTIKDFDYFEDRHSFIDSDSDKLFGNSLFLLRGKRWRDMRSTLSPTFTGNKMRQMFELVSDCAEDVSTYLLKEADANQKIEWEVKDLFSRYGNDVIASCAFGLKVNSLEDDKNEIYTIGARLLDFNSLKVTLRVLLLMMFPRLMKTLNIELFDKSDSSFFRSLVLDTMNNRAKKNIIRSDMINQLMQVRNGSNEYRIAAETTSFAMVEESDIGRREVKRRWSDDELVAQCFLFFSAGYDTTVTLLSFLCYELTVNPEIQARLFDEILAVSKRIVGRRVDFDLLKSMKYMDQVVSEALRLWPPILKVERLCSRDYLFDDGVDTRFHIEKGRVVWIPISTIHRDPNYWPEPDKFDPERFSDENKSNIIPGTFLAFGIGPRNCIGTRFALMEIKVVLFNLLLHFRLEPTVNTQIPLKLAKGSVLLHTEKGIHVEFKPRNST